jgi:YesN/AraC family two-component response regulator
MRVPTDLVMPNKTGFDLLQEINHQYTLTSQLS